MRTRLFFLLCFLLVPLLLWGQEFRATVTGTVTDSTKAAIPNATVTVRNLDTNQSTVVKTNETGNYTVPFLRPGQRYEVIVEAPGFKKASYPPVTVTIGQVLTANVEMQVGTTSDQVTVTSAAPLLEVAKADRGGLVSNTTIKELPLNGRNPLMLSTMVAGVNFKGKNPGDQARPFDQYEASQFSINGGKNMNNEFLLDGMPNNAYVWYGNGVSTVPSVDAMQEFKIVTNPYDAQYGRTAGGVINMSLKSGSNKLHGSVYEFARRTWLDANDWFSNANGYSRLEHKEDQYGFQVDGPVYLPKVYDGRNKTFFMFNMERFRQSLPMMKEFLVPDPRWATGDFSGVLDGNGTPYLIYDPSTANAGNNYTRSPFPGNKIPVDRLNPIALKLFQFFPKPNFVDSGDPNRQYWITREPDTNHNNAYVLKVDQRIGERDSIFVNYTRNSNESWGWWGPTGSIAADGSLPYQQMNSTGGIDWVHTFNSNVLFNFHGGVQRYRRTDTVQKALGYDITQLGFPSSLADQIPLKKFPMVRPTDYIGLSRNYYLMPNDSYSAAPTLTWVRGKHTMKLGADMRLTHYAQLTNWTGGMELDFNGQATQQFWDGSSSTTGDTSGNPFADMLLGIPNNVKVDYTLTPYYSWHYYAPFFQDDWKVTNKLTVNLGLRWDLNGPVTERRDRISYGFDQNAVNPINALVDHTAFPSLGTVKGGMKFAGVNGNRRSPYEWDLNNIQPRIGAAYQLTPNTVLRGGWGLMYMNPVDTGNAYGFQYQTPFVASLDGNRTFQSNLMANPFPSGIVVPPGSSLGLTTYAGQGFYFRQEHYKIPYVSQFSFGIQHELPKKAALELTYVGSRSYAQETTWDAFNDNVELRKACDYTKGGNKALCTDRVPNPFYNVAGVTGSMGTSPTLSKYQLARPYPLFGGIGVRLLNDGHYWYNSFQATYKQHLSWLELNGAYTWSKNMESGGYVDQYLKNPMRAISEQDRAHNLTVSSVFQIPVGRNRKFFSGMNRMLDMVLGGWELGSGFTWQTGLPWNWKNDTQSTKFQLVGNPKAAKGNKPGVVYGGVSGCTEKWNSTTNSWELTDNSKKNSPGCTPVWRIYEGYMEKTTQPRTDLIRQPGFYQIDSNLGKTMKVMEGLSVQIRLECFNVLNHPTWNWDYNADINNAKFGTIDKASTGQANPSRQVQLGMKVIW